MPILRTSTLHGGFLPAYYTGRDLFDEALALLGAPLTDIAIPPTPTPSNAYRRLLGPGRALAALDSTHAIRKIELETARSTTEISDPELREAVITFERDPELQVKDWRKVDPYNLLYW